MKKGKNKNIIDMKTYSKNIVIAILSAFLLNACIDEDVIKTNGSNVEEGIPVTASLSFISQSVGEQEVTTKSALSTEVEYKVKDIYVFVFKKTNDGYVHETSQLFNETDIKNAQTINEKGEGESKGTLTLDLTSGEKKIFAIANMGDVAAYKATQNLGEIQTIDDLKTLAVELTSPEAPVDRSSGLLLMSGAFAPTSSPSNPDINVSLSGGDVTINEQGIPTVAGKIYLKRLDSRIKFNISTSNNIDFTPKGYRIVNVPVASYFFEKSYVNDGSHDYVLPGGEESTYKATKPKNEYTNFDAITTHGEGKYNGGNFTFYMFENRKPAKEGMPDDYNERERQNKDSEGKNGDYTYAHKYATYVEIVGSYYEKYEENGESKDKSAEVKYTIHLGYVKGQPEDFKSERNCAYTYKVTIAGVNNIEVEVETSNDREQDFQENQPGAEGHVVKSKQFYYVDAHYITDKIIFNKDNVSDDASFRVKTPFDLDGRGDAAKDYKWVWFVQNEKIQEGGKVTKYTYSGLKQRRYGDGLWNKRFFPANKVVPGGSAPFPKSYTRTSSVSQEKIDWDDWYYTNENIQEEQVDIKWTYKEDFVPFPSELEKDKRLNIVQLIEKLKSKANQNADASETSIYDSQGNAVFTIFIDEYYYDTDPTNPSTTPHWSKFVNKDNREMHILCDTEFSLDGESSLTTSNFLISQKSIKTFYNSSSPTGWGVESVNEKIHDEAKEDGRLPIQYNSEIKDLDKSNGRYNMYQNLKYISDKTPWSDYIEPTTNWLKKRKYNKNEPNTMMLQYACLQRNRDLDGDGRIDNDEVRWYMPAVNQLTGLFLGKDALPSDVHLMQNGINVTQNNYNNYHYTNSNNIQFWAEEGAATGTNTTNNSYWNYRCVRNLGIHYNQVSDYPTETNEVADYVAPPTITAEGHILLDLSAVNPNALRIVPDQGKPLAITDELSEYNRPFTKFLVNKDLSKKPVHKNNIYDNNVENPCPEGWRMPNMRELTLILAYSGKTDNSFSATTSSLSYKKDIKAVYKIDFNSIITLNNVVEMKVRCVKDIE